MQMSFDDYVLMKGLQFKAQLTSNLATATALLKDETMEKLGQKNLCFRIDPVLQARFEATIDALEISKQDALTRMLAEMLDRIDERLATIGIGKISYKERLQELGYDLTDVDDSGYQRIVRIATPGTGE